MISLISLLIFEDIFCRSKEQISTMFTPYEKSGRQNFVESNRISILSLNSQKVFKLLKKIVIIPQIILNLNVVSFLS